MIVSRRSQRVILEVCHTVSALGLFVTQRPRLGDRHGFFHCKRGSNNTSPETGTNSSITLWNGVYYDSGYGCQRKSSILVCVAFAHFILTDFIRSVGISIGQKLKKLLNFYGLQFRRVRAILDETVFDLFRKWKKWTQYVCSIYTLFNGSSIVLSHWDFLITYWYFTIC